MQLEDYFDFLAPDDIRIKGSRIGIETVLHDYIHKAMTAEEIADQYDTLSLQQVYATILYYLHNLLPRWVTPPRGNDGRVARRLARRATLGNP